MCRCVKGGFAALMLLLAGPAFAQGGAAPLEQRRLPDLPAPTPAPPDRPVLPRPEVPPLQAPDDGAARFVLKDAVFVGATVFDDARLKTEIAAFIGRPVSIVGLEQARRRLTRLYVSEGYVNSGVLIPEQDIVDGVVRFEVVEGRLTEIDVRGEGVGAKTGPFGDLHPDYVVARIGADDDAPLKVDRLEERFRILLQDPMVEQLNGALVPGRALGEAALQLEVVRAKPLSVFLRIDNHDPESTGEAAVSTGFTLRNSFGFADSATMSFEASEGRQAALASFVIPVSSDGVRLLADGEIAQTAVVEEPFDLLDIESQYFRARIAAAWDVWRTSIETFTLEIAGESKTSRTTLLGAPFSFSAGADNGVSRTTALRFAQQYIFRGAESAVSLRSTFSLGLDALGATDNDGGGPDGQFGSWLGQAFATHRFEEGFSLTARATAQAAFDRLLSIEQVALGGAGSVRGYEESAVTEDAVGYVTLSATSPVIEAPIPGLSPEGHRGALRVSPFISTGVGWTKGAFGDRTELTGAGVTFDWSPFPAMAVEAGFGLPLRARSPIATEELEDARAYFAMTVRF